MNKITRLLFASAALLIVLSLCACSLVPGGSSSVATTAAPTAAQVMPDAQLSDVLRAFYQNDLPVMALHSGVPDTAGQEILCDNSMLQKTVFVDYDADMQDEIVLLYDVSEKVGVRGRDVIVFVDERDGAPVVACAETGSYGKTSDDETYILTRYNSRVCKVRFINDPSYEAVVVDVFEDGAWKTNMTAYHHISDHDRVSLEKDSCYIDHSGGGLFDAVTGKTTYSKEKFLNFRTPVEHYNELVTALLVDTLLP